MHSNLVIGLSDADASALAAIIHDIEQSQAVIAAAQAAQTRALARAGELARRQAARALARVREHDMALRAIAAEVAGAMRTTDRSAQRQIGEAGLLADDYSATLEAWEAGLITRGHVRAIVDAGAVLPAEDRPAFETTALTLCVHETPGRVRGRLALLAERMHPTSLAERHSEARSHRRVRVLPLPDGMSDLCATVPALLADAIYDRLTQQARSIVDARSHAADEVAASDTRTMDQLRTDVLADMLLTAAPDADPTRIDDGPGTLGAIRARVQIVVPALALVGADDAPADLVGRSPIDADTAYEIAAATRMPWERVIAHPVTGAVLHVDTYHRTAAIDRFLRARDQHCRFPGCRIPAVRCEVDHTVDHALGGTTDVGNLAHLCQRHHSMKQFTAWRVRQRGEGVLEWTSPLGRTYIENPPDLGVHFRAIDELPDDAPADPDVVEDESEEAPF